VLGTLCAGIAEDVKVRGMLSRLLEQSLGTWVAIGLSALFLGLGHWRNPGATVRSSLAIAFEAGILLAALYAATRSPWPPIGLHWAWSPF
jgi:membrane protease YdiL (CAAX protease family)